MVDRPSVRSTATSLNKAPKSPGPQERAPNLILRPLQILSAASALRVQPVLTDPDIDHQRNQELDHILHVRAHQLRHGVYLFWRRLEDQLVVNLKQHAALETALSDCS